MDFITPEDFYAFAANGAYLTVRDLVHAIAAWVAQNHDGHDDEVETIWAGLAIVSTVPNQEHTFEPKWERGEER